MPLRMIVACEGMWSVPCRAFLPLDLCPPALAATQARQKGWTVEDVVLCPDCTRKEEESADA